MLDPTSKVFYTGGLPTIHGPAAQHQPSRARRRARFTRPDRRAAYPIPPFTVPPEVAPADGCYNGFNIFAMTVSSPKQSYFLNYTTDFDGSIGSRTPSTTPTTRSRSPSRARRRSTST